MNFKFFSDKAKTFKYLAIICGTLLILCAFFMIIYTDAFYTSNTDDLAQYFKMSEDFVLKIKTGNLSYYNFNNYLGASFFSDTYYVPLDIFTFITFILSFFMNFEMAFGLTEMIKLFLGTMLFAYFLSLRKCSNKAIFITTLLYFACGYNNVMMAFSAFFSLAFYFPFAAIAIEKFKEGKKLFVTLAVATLIFYNYYLGCCTMLFMGLWFIVSYFLDNKLETIENNLRNINSNLKHIKAKAVFLYIVDLFKQGFNCIFYMVIGFLIAASVLLPSLAHVLKDALQRGDTSFYKWSFDSTTPYEIISSKDIYARVLAELFTPGYSTNFYAFNNDYITDHISLYITITGLMMMLYVFSLKDRESWIYKIVLIFEVVLLAFPIFYMAFSLNSAPYTRWVGLLNMFNLLIVAHVITKTDLKFKFASVWVIIRSLLLIGIIVVVLNFFSNRLFGVNLLKLMAKGYDNVVFNTDSIGEFIEDMVFLGVAIGVIIVLTVGSVEKINKKFNILPFVLTTEIVIAFGYMFVPKFENYGCLSMSNRKEELNGYLKTYLENPYDNDFSRTHIYTDTTNDFVYERNYTRTNLYLSDLRLFHSFYDASANELAALFYDRGSKNSEERNSKEVLNQYSLFVHQLLANRYVVIDSKSESYLPSPYFKLINDDGEYASYENMNYTPFMIYDSINSSLGTFDLYSNHMTRQQYLLNSAKIDDLEGINMPVISNSVSCTKKKYSQSHDGRYYDAEDDDFYIYNISGSSYNSLTGIPNEGIMHFYYDYGGTRCVEFNEVYIEYASGKRVEALDGYAFYDEIPTKILVSKNDTGSLSNYALSLYIEYTDFTEYDKFIERMNDYDNLKLDIDGSKLKLSYDRKNDKENIVALPIAYNDCWNIDKDYQKVVVNGGFLGIIIPEGENNISMTLTFEPKYQKESAIISCIGSIGLALVVLIDWRRRKNEEDFNYCSLL